MLMEHLGNEYILKKGGINKIILLWIRKKKKQLNVPVHMVRKEELENLIGRTDTEKARDIYDHKSS